MTLELLPMLADAAQGGNIAATLPLAFAGGGAGIGVGLVGAKAAEAVGRNPGELPLSPPDNRSLIYERRRTVWGLLAQLDRPDHPFLHCLLGFEQVRFQADHGDA
jgi:hypothetical protein